MTSLSTLSTDELGEGICLRAGRIAAAEAELLPWVAEFDRREGWAGTGLLSCAHWLAWKVGLSLGAAREQVRVARRLEDLPEVAEAYGAGRISYSKVRAITRVAEPQDGIDWVEHARHSTASQLENVVRGVRRARAAERAQADPETAAWQLRTRVRYHEDGHFTFTISGPAEFLPVVQGGLEAKRAELQRQRDAEATAEVEVEVEAAVGAAPDVPAETPAGVVEREAKPDLELDLERVDVPAGTSPELDLDAPVPGWPAGTTVRDVQTAAGSFFTNLPRWREPLPDPEVDLDDPEVRAARQQRDSTSAAPDVPAETPTPPAQPAQPAQPTQPARVTDAEALLALAQDALVAEQTAHPAISRRRRPQLTAQIDPLSGWGRLADGELLPPRSLRAVMKTLPGRGGVLRLRPVTQADLRAHDLGRTAREATAALRQLLGSLDGERCRFPGCTRHRKLHAHHVRYWSEGGSTDLDNLVLVRLSHESRAFAVFGLDREKITHGCERAVRRSGSAAADAPLDQGLAA